MIYNLKIPDDLDKISGLRMGDVLYITGKVFTARDEAHQLMLELHEKGEKLPFDPSKMVLYHCGPVVKRENNEWKVLAAGPTTSSRMDLFEKEVIEIYGVRIIVGKGGMGDRTSEALKKVKGIYATYTGGAGALAAKSFKKVLSVYYLEELGSPEAIWIFEAENFGPLIVSIDPDGKNWNKLSRDEMEKRKKEIFELIDHEGN
ncbi:MAG: FumA C-terminus/TtdB family hydratase beta subunit [Thermoplasmata archaeon]|jgi:fumarate hydratase subunit beta|nr:fumarate hydratase C-terminal domain-containing protein [Thermoplasmata archaeon]MVT13356.1 fumarate hydratase [Euryarchaeota archaeon]MVT14644.1 fumarate hydratase [Euryarchaeota archaeon]MVT35274.1 fumarate hydratase [Euryarchaeota archaeon]